MAQLELQPAESSKTRRRVHAFIHIDMTPMVDLGFLLISFFIFTTSLMEKNTISLIMPRNSSDSTPVQASKALTFLLAENNQVFAYEGRWNDAVQNNRIISTNYNGPTGMRDIIRMKQKHLDKADDVIIVIKPLEKASYKNTIDALDEMLINGVTKYAVVEPTTEEKRYVEKS